jgi:trans-AT polyketide synthase/acyltransferase/oxidoreductase domain-containing protein
LVQRRGELMAAASGGGMLAVVGLEPARVVEVLAASGCTQVDVANDNSPRQVVLAGPRAALDEAAALLNQRPNTATRRYRNTKPRSTWRGSPA